MHKSYQLIQIEVGFLSKKEGKGQQKCQLIFKVHLSKIEWEGYLRNHFIIIIILTNLYILSQKFYHKFIA